MDQSKLERLLGVGPALAEGLDLETVLGRILDAAREVTGARYAALGVLDEQGAMLERFLPSGLSEEEIKSIGDLPRGHGVLGELIRNPHPLLLEDVGEHPQSYGFPVGHPPMHSFLGVPIRVRGEAYGNLYLTEKDGGDFDADDQEIVERLADWAGIAIDNARLFGNVRSRHADLERNVRILETHVEIAKAIGAETEIGPVLDLVVKRARALVEARGMTVALVQGGELVVSHLAGQLDRSLIGYRIPLEGSVAGETLRTGRATRLSDVSGEGRQIAVRMAGAKAVLIVPLVLRDAPLGVLTAVDRMTDGPQFDADDERLLKAFAASASIAVASAQRATQKSLRRSLAASEQERARWARELHDETLQDIGALRVMLTTAARSDDGDALPVAVEDAIGRLSDISSSLRNLITDLRPALLDQLGPKPALEAMVNRLAEQSDLRIDLVVDLAYESGRVDTRHSPELELTTYRVVQEALNNVIKHSGAAEAQVQISENAEVLEIEVRDNGTGFDPNVTTGGFGLTGLRERVEQLDGSVQIATGPDRGTVMHATLPVIRRDAPVRSDEPALP